MPQIYKLICNITKKNAFFFVKTEIYLDTRILIYL